MMEFQRPLAVPPGTPMDRLEIVRKAFEEALKDPELPAEAEKSKIVITYVPGPEVKKLVDEILNMPAEARESLSLLVRYKRSHNSVDGTASGPLSLL